MYYRSKNIFSFIIYLFIFVFISFRFLGVYIVVVILIVKKFMATKNSTACAVRYLSRLRQRSEVSAQSSNERIMHRNPPWETGRRNDDRRDECTPLMDFLLLLSSCE